MSIKGAMSWTRSNLMKFEMMAALAGGIAVSAALPDLAQRALSKVGLSFDLTSGYRATVSSLALAGLGGYAATASPTCPLRPLVCSPSLLWSPRPSAP